MVTKKTSTEETAKVASKKTEAGKVAGGRKKDTQKSPIAHENIDVVGEVLEIKAHNDEKKQAKQVKKPVAKVKAAAEVVAPKGEKVITDTNKRAARKATVQASDAKKFQALKEEKEGCCAKCCCRQFFGKVKEIFYLWALAYRQMFTYKARTSRYEFWAFKFVNSLVLTVLGTAVLVKLYHAIINTPRNETGIASLMLPYAIGGGIVVLIELLVVLALTCRRLHDTGYTVWKGFFRPLVYTSIINIVLSGIGIYVADAEITSNSGLFAVSCGYLILLISWLVNLYYLFKVVIVSSFIEEEKVENAYGLPLYNDQCHKDRAIALATFTIFFGILIWNLFSGYGALLPVVYGM
jgi:uncharacterized membrane protein YhaH (DUF805 family)